MDHGKYNEKSLGDKGKTIGGIMFCKLNQKIKKR